MTTTMTPYLYGLENFGGECAMAYFEDHGNGRLKPQRDWTPISRETYQRLYGQYFEFRSTAELEATITYYDLDAQRKAARLDALAAELRERNDMASDAGRGVL